MSRTRSVVFALASLVAFSSVKADAGPSGPAPLTVAQMMATGQAVDGNSYWWGHGRILAGASDRQLCQGSCPSCSMKPTTDGTKWGADCSGFVAKAWQVPSASPLASDSHPLSTSDFSQPETQWWSTPKDLQPGDALVWRKGGAGHVVLVTESHGAAKATNRWGKVHVYECKGCAYGCVSGTRSFNGYSPRRRKNVDQAADAGVQDASDASTPLDAGGDGASSDGGQPDPKSCTGYAQSQGWELTTVVCDTGSGACLGQGVATTECAKCCNLGCADDTSCPSGAVCAWNGTSKCCRAPGAASTLCFSDAECPGGQVCAWNGEHFYCAAPRCGG